jgi:hypothetical protein
MIRHLPDSHHWSIRAETTSSQATLTISFGRQGTRRSVPLPDGAAADLWARIGPPVVLGTMKAYGRSQSHGRCHEAAISRGGRYSPPGRMSDGPIGNHSILMIVPGASQVVHCYVCTTRISLIDCAAHST